MQWIFLMLKGLYIKNQIYAITSKNKIYYKAKPIENFKSLMGKIALKAIKRSVTIKTLK